MDKNEALHTRFEKAFAAANSMDDIDIPIDLRLQFYAFYKQASPNANFYRTGDPDMIRNAFKMNALLQVNSLTPDEAKLAYIELVNETITKYNVKINFI